MLSIKAVRFQNTFSFGNTLTEIRLDEPGPTLVVGKNGAGKSSSILDTLVYGLFGKPYRKIRVGQMINAITNREALVEVDFTTRGASWMVRRGQKPSVFEVYRDGQLVDQAASVRDQQDWFERQVLRIDHKSFVQTVILGSANHVPFMKLTASQRREVVEDILDIQVFSHMNEILKERAGELKDSLTDVERSLAVSQRELEVEERHVESLRRDVDQEREELVAQAKEMFAALESARSQAKEHQDRARELTESIVDEDEVTADVAGVRAELASLRTTLASMGRTVRFFAEHSDCPTCSQGIDAEFRAAQRDRLTREGEEVRGRIATLEADEARLDARLQDVAAVHRSVSQADREFIRCGAEVRSLTDQLKQIQVKIQGLRTESAANQDLLDSLRARVEELGRTRDGLRTEAATMAHAVSLLKDQGIKARIVARYVPLMNRLVNKYLAALELFVDFRLDENFTEEIRSRHRDTFSYESFSEGERMRIDLAILFAWRDIARSRNSSAVDLLIFDEILDSSMDVDGIDYFLRILRDMTDGTRVFIISHRDGVEDKFESVLTFTKRNNFSSVTRSSGKL